MSPRTADQFKNIRKEKRQLILDASLKVFAKNGFHEASISSIAKEAKISKGLIYNYFTSKEEILKETVIFGLDIMFAQFKIESEKLNAEAFSKMIELTFDIIDKDIAYWQIYFSVIMQSEVMLLVQEKLMSILMPIIENFALFFKSMGYENPYGEARFFGATIDGLSLNYIVDPESFPKEYCINRLKRIYNLP